MNFAPQHDWDFYNEKVSAASRDQSDSRTPEERLEQYLDYYDTIHAAKKGLVNQMALNKARWQNKLKLREKMVQCFSAMDALNNG